ncbi:hypothetical protein [Pseudonocardia charpentierae]|uniref:Uncharacterized protein n=1 Tax=Pseudonocardia charpentierae TaxID=3075545 RepID=A0ABU2NGQ2_9PSEU|nr:hypothetical protein [Pseudonocardia sp. DSM 45834]MDT0352900.1 hypothetical protein [Pseudonocardia sp. DSM 45834]
MAGRERGEGGNRHNRWNGPAAGAVYDAVTKQPTLRVLAALPLTDHDDPVDERNLEAPGMLLARHVLREIDNAHDGSEQLPHRAHLHPVR